MWLFNNLPEEYLEKTHKFKVTKEWLENVQKSSVRFNSGGSGSVVSHNGVVLPKPHAGAVALQKIGNQDHKHHRDGCPPKHRHKRNKRGAMGVKGLMEIEEVRQEVEKAVGGLDASKAVTGRRAAIATIEKEAKDKYKLQPQVVTLYQGGAYHLYLFKKYTDVRLVFAPEQ